MKKRLVGFTISVVAVVVVAVASFICFKVQKADAADKGVAAKINGEVVYINDLKQSYADHPQIKDRVSFEEFYAKTLDVFVNSKLVYQAAKAAKIEETPEYQRQLVTAKEDLARKLYLEKKVDEKVTDEEIKKLYDEYVSKFESQKEVKAKHILVDTEEKAKEVIAKLKKGEDFVKLAQEYSKDQVDLGYFTKEVMVPEFSDAAFAMNKGEYSKTPVKTDFGYHVILVEDVRASKPLTLKDVEPQLKNMVTQQVVAQIFEDLVKNAKVEKFTLEGEPITDKK
ncbi:MAG: peptidyl-prolyl cis-trans isomerase [Alphaproteobacteria bacterium]|nr:peptidyl-prolyl cis-trans isomerase [Alphaproteobacteria bacterium]